VAVPCPAVGEAVAEIVPDNLVVGHTSGRWWERRDSEPVVLRLGHMDSAGHLQELAWLGLAVAAAGLPAAFSETFDWRAA